MVDMSKFFSPPHPKSRVDKPKRNKGRGRLGTVGISCLIFLCCRSGKLSKPPPTTLPNPPIKPFLRFFHSYKTRLQDRPPLPTTRDGSPRSVCSDEAPNWGPTATADHSTLVQRLLLFLLLLSPISNPCLFLHSHQPRTMGPFYWLPGFLRRLRFTLEGFLVAESGPEADLGAAGLAGAAGAAEAAAGCAFVNDGMGRRRG